MPIAENIKAPFDLEIVDADATQKLYDETAANVRQVFNFDSESMQRLQVRIAEAFATRRAPGAISRH